MALTVRAVVGGAFAALVMTVANVYLGLRVGMTVSASIPAAVAVGIYLPLSLSVPILFGGIVQWLVTPTAGPRGQPGGLCVLRVDGVP